MHSTGIATQDCVCGGTVGSETSLEEKEEEEEVVVVVVVVVVVAAEKEELQKQWELRVGALGGRVGRGQH
jgi:hypothetical protein